MEVTGFMRDDIVPQLPQQRVRIADLIVDIEPDSQQQAEDPPQLIPGQVADRRG